MKLVFISSFHLTTVGKKQKQNKKTFKPSSVMDSPMGVKQSDELRPWPTAFATAYEES